MTAAVARALVPLVEGQGEVETVPVLLRRILAEQGAYDVQIARPFRVRRNQVVKEGELERAVMQAARDRDDAAALLVLLDADDDCPRELGPTLLERCRRATRLPVAVVLANREFGAWFLGAKESLRGVSGIRDDALPPNDPESIRGAKEHLTANMGDRRYLEVYDQPVLTHHMDLTAVGQRCPSFEKLQRAVASLVAQMIAAG